MKLFEEPKLELIAFAVEDVVSTSTATEEPPALGGMIGDVCVS